MFSTKRRSREHVNELLESMKMNRKPQGGKSYYLNDDSDIVALDFETLQLDKKVIVPSMLGVCHMSPDGDIKDEYVLDRKNSKGDYTGRYGRKTDMERQRWKDVKWNHRELRKFMMDILYYVTLRRICNEKKMCFHNLKFDIGIILKGLTEEECVRLKYEDRVIVHDKERNIKYSISIIGDFASVSIRRENVKRKWRHTARIFDTAQTCFAGSLENSMKTWCGIENAKEGFHTEEVFTNPDKLNEVYDEAVEYCQKDAHNLAILFSTMREKFEEQGIPFSAPHSGASLFRGFCKVNPRVDIPKITGIDIRFETAMNNDNYKWLKDRWENSLRPVHRICAMHYYGGRFEIFEKGVIEDVVAYDESSQYPDKMRLLPDIRDINTYYYTGETIKERYKDYDWGVIKIRLWTDKNGKIAPLAVRMKGKTCFPHWTGQTTWVSLQDLDFLLQRYPHVEKMDIMEGYLIKEHSKCRRPFDFIEVLYDKRKEMKEKYGSNSPQQLAYKILMNGGYGTQAETREEVSINKLDNGFVGTKIERVAGTMYNPFYAFHITDMSRLNMLEFIYSHDLEEYVVQIATDCVFFKNGTKVKEKMEQNSKWIFSDLGGMELEEKKHGTMYLIASGVYFLKHKGNLQGASRGFKLEDFPNPFEEEWDNKSTKIPYTSIRPYSWKEAVHARQDLFRVGYFEEHKKELDVNSDDKRNWDRDFESAREAQETSISSKPLVMGVDDEVVE